MGRYWFPTFTLERNVTKKKEKRSCSAVLKSENENEKALRARMLVFNPDMSRDSKINSEF